MKNELPVEMPVRPPPLVVKRVLNAPQSLVFKAFGHESHIRRWFSPEGCSCPEAEVDFRVGGAFNVVMELPDGTRHSVRAYSQRSRRPSGCASSGWSNPAGSSASGSTRLSHWPRPASARS